MDDDRLAVLADFLDGGAPAHHHRTAPGVIGRNNALLAEDAGAGREIRTLYVIGDQLVDAESRIFDQRATGVDHLAQVMGRDVGRHADGNTAGAVDQQVGELGRQHRRLMLGFVIVGLEIDGFLVDVLDQGMRGAGHAGLGIAHGRRPVAVHGAEVALAVDQRQAHGEILRHPDHGVIDRLVAVGVVLTHDVTDDARRFTVRLVVFVAVFLHRIEDAPMHRFQSVADIRQGAADDYAHSVIKVRTAHFLFDGDRCDVRIRRGRCRWRVRRCGQ